MSVRFLLAAAALLAPTCAQAFTANDLQGPWRITFSNATQNTITLAGPDADKAGAYFDDSGETCSVSNKFVAAYGAVRIRVACAQWTMTMDGVVSPNGDEIKGSFQTSTASSGAFRMVKR